MSDIFNKRYFVTGLLLLSLLGAQTLYAASSSVSHRFVAGEQTVKDRKTGTVWVRNGCMSGKELNWMDAQKFLNGLNKANFGGYNDWGFPSKAALEELTEYCVSASTPVGDKQSCATLLNTAGFQTMQEGFYWSSSKLGRNNFFSLVVSMTDGTSKNVSKEQPMNLLPMHGGR